MEQDTTSSLLHGQEFNALKEEISAVRKEIAILMKMQEQILNLLTKHNKDILVNEDTETQLLHEEVEVSKELKELIDEPPIIINKTITPGEEKEKKQRVDEMIELVSCAGRNKEKKPCQNKVYKFEKFCTFHQNYQETTLGKVSMECSDCQRNIRKPVEGSTKCSVCRRKNSRN